MRKLRITTVIELVLLICVIAFIGFMLGIHFESRDNLNKDKEILVGELIGDFDTVRYLMQHWTQQIDESNGLKVYVEDYNMILREVEELKGTLEISDRILHGDGYSIPFHRLNNSIEVSFMIIEGLEMKDDRISNDFFDDNVINKSEANYINELASDIEMMTVSLRGTINTDNNMVDFTYYEQSIEAFISKYQIGEELYDFVITN